MYLWCTDNKLNRKDLAKLRETKSPLSYLFNRMKMFSQAKPEYVHFFEEIKKEVEEQDKFLQSADWLVCEVDMIDKAEESVLFLPCLCADFMCKW